MNKTVTNLYSNNYKHYLKKETRVIVDTLEQADDNNFEEIVQNLAVKLGRKPVAIKQHFYLHGIKPKREQVAKSIFCREKRAESSTANSPEHTYAAALAYVVKLDNEHMEKFLRIFTKSLTFKVKLKLLFGK